MDIVRRTRLGTLLCCVCTAIFLVDQCAAVSPQSRIASSFRGVPRNSPWAVASVNSAHSESPRKKRVSKCASLASVPSSPPTDEPGERSGTPAGRADQENRSDSGLRYFSDLLGGSIDDKRDREFVSYAEKCESARKLLEQAFAKVLPQYVDLVAAKPSVGNGESGQPASLSAAAAVNRGRILDDAVVSAIGRYIDMTKEGLPGKGGWFSFGKSRAPSDGEQLTRLNELVRLILALEWHMYDAFREYVASHKLHFISKMFTGEKDAMLKLTEARYIKSLQREFIAAVNRMVPLSFKAMPNGAKSVAALLRHVAKVDASLADAVSSLLTQQPDPVLVLKLTQSIARWNALKDVDEFSALLAKLSASARSGLQRHIQSTEKQDRLMQALASQQQQIELYQKQLGAQSQSQSPLSCGFSYRMPNTNFNILGSMQRGPLGGSVDDGLDVVDNGRGSRRRVVGGGLRLVQCADEVLHVEAAHEVRRLGLGACTFLRGVLVAAAAEVVESEGARQVAGEERPGQDAHNVGDAFGAVVDRLAPLGLALLLGGRLLGSIGPLFGGPDTVAEAFGEELEVLRGVDGVLVGEFVAEEVDVVTVLQVNRLGERAVVDVVNHRHRQALDVHHPVLGDSVDGVEW
ncbi:peripheral plastid protein 1, putative [Babesia caballi]|uniref:Peripheral plastid protein 1, putative n=1 Tax=Babesia caballi TaxID=5871 RepID=A0AAV4LSK8_BABCB|nr:peripheral plastid protein 1, putative [Babesia caballi]